MTRRSRYIRYTYAGNPLPHRPAPPSMTMRSAGRRVPQKLGFGRILTGLVAVIAVIAIVSTIATTVGAYNAYAQIAASLKPRLDTISSRNTFQTSRIYDRNGTLLYEFFDKGKRTRIRLEEISPLLRQATIAIEDSTFFENTGVDYVGIGRALLQSASAGSEVSGASTITQQLVRGVVLTADEKRAENRYQRKLTEIVLAQEMNQSYTKNQILELYLNEIFYGNLAYGIEAASNVYFNVHAKDLSLPQAALLAGLPQLPTVYDPINYLQHDEQGEKLPGVNLPKNWLNPNTPLSDEIPPPKRRQISVLRQMVAEGYVTETQARQAASEDLRFVQQDAPLNAPHFVFYVRRWLEEHYGSEILAQGGLNITTTLDLNLQNMVQIKAAERITELEERNIHNASVVVMQPRTGQILAMVGSVDYHAVLTTKTPGEEGNVLDGQVNVATRERQPGSALKPFTYLSAMEQGLTPASVLWDVPTEFPAGGGQWYAPKNYTGRWNGPVRIRGALANSLNMPAVKALRAAGIAHTLDLLDRVGIKTGLKRGEGYYGLALTLGGGEVTLLELTTAYNTLANGGQYIPATPILRITNNEGQVIESFEQKPGEQAISPQLVGIITNMMSDDEARAPIWGRNSKLKLTHPAAVKTGTSSDWRDAWTLGFTPYLTVGVWSGNNNNEPTKQVESIEGGGIIWHNVMEEIFKLIDEKPHYQELFDAPFAPDPIPLAFTAPEKLGLVRAPTCPIPGGYGGPREELFTPEMLNGTNVISDTNGTTHRAGSSRTCDAYTRVNVMEVPSGEGKVSYCIPERGVDYPGGRLVDVFIWNTPPADPDVKVQYRWSWGSAGGASIGGNSVNLGGFPRCSTIAIAPTAEPTATQGPSGPRMPNLSGWGENEAKNLLRGLGYSDIYIDYQDRSRIPDIFDRFQPYTVVSTIPKAGEPIQSGMTIIIGIRGPDGSSPNGQPIPTVTPAPVNAQPTGGTVENPFPVAPTVPSGGEPPPTVPPPPSQPTDVPAGPTAAPPPTSPPQPTAGLWEPGQPTPDPNAPSLQLPVIPP